MIFYVLAILVLFVIEIGFTKETKELWLKRVLTTNNNGIDDIKIMQLARVFAKVSETYIVAPSEDRSGTTHFALIVSKGSIAA
jgi:hypothetical protein